ncbi:hypothetical protein DFH08DRAFT_270819 [Mycena albidolilacea]|uniref:Uncharacterized protein n=1 Tax=Mycena albidolilacea TaxID=1033008 RepID=A0AAD7F395_9AGAR|nr:hypothetical protein DFH08DRAFT_270819 [Mycena albidolilacea]
MCPALSLTLAMVEADEQIARLRVTAHISHDSKNPNLWKFGELSATTSEPVSSQVIAYVSHMKVYWRPQSGLEVPQEWTSIILPPAEDPESPGTPIELERWFPLSLISAILLPVSSKLQPVSAASLSNRYMSADYVGPLFPVRDPPEDAESSVVRAMVNLLLCEHHPPGVFYCLASLLRGTYGCQLKLQPGHRFPPHFGDDLLQIDFGLVPEWQPTTEDMVRRSREAPLCFSSPALAIGMRLQDSDGESCTLTRQELMCLARATQPHLEALLLARHHRYPEPLLATSPLPPACIFVIAFRDMTIFIVAHIAFLQETTYRYQSLVVDQIPFPPYVPGEREGVVGRLRVIVALLTIRSHTDHLASLWDDLIWDPTIIDAELAVLRDFTGIVTPSPSEYEDPEVSFWGDMLDDIKLSPGGEEVATDVDPSPSEIASSKELVDVWLLGAVDAEDVPESTVPES